VYAREMHAHEVDVYEMQMTPIQIDALQCLKRERVLAPGGCWQRGGPESIWPVIYTSMRCTPMRCTPMRYTPICEVNACKMCAREMHAHEIYVHI